MTLAELGRRFFETTRGQIVARLRRRAHTVEELARALGLTDNAVRNHLATLERDGIVRQEGLRRGPGAGKPAVVYELHPEADALFSRAYRPLLTATLDVLVAELPPDQAASVLEKVGRRVAQVAGGRATGSLDDRATAAAAVLRSLGGDVEVVTEDGTVRLRASGCPLGSTVAQRPEACRAVEALVSEIVGVPVRECCSRGARPRCCFTVQPAA